MLAMVYTGRTITKRRNVRWCVRFIDEKEKFEKSQDLKVKITGIGQTSFTQCIVSRVCSSV